MVNFDKTISLVRVSMETGQYIEHMANDFWID